MRTSRHSTLVSILAATLLTIAAGAANSQPDVDTAALEPAADALCRALTDHDFAEVVPHLDSGFEYAGFGGSMARTILRQVVEGFPDDLTSCELTGATTSDDRPSASLRLGFDGREDESHELRFSTGGQLLRAEVAQISIAGHGDEPTRGRATRSASESVPDRMTVPFELFDRLIVVEAEVEGVRGRFIVDTGAAAALTLNSSRFPELTRRGTPTATRPHGANGVIESAVEAEADDFRWRRLRLPRVPAVIWNLDHLSKATGIDDLLGLIGADLFERFLLELDYANRRLTLHRLEPDGRPTLEIPPADLTIPAEILFHLPVVEVELGGRSLRLGIDSGAEGAMLQTRWQAPLAGHYSELGTSSMTGAGDNVQLGLDVRFEEMTIAGLRLRSVPFRFNDLRFPHEIRMDGLLGYDFLRRFRTGINLRRAEVLIWTE